MIKKYINYINEILSYCGVSQSELAKTLGVTQAALNRWVKGHAAPRPKMVEKIAQYYKEKVRYPALSKSEVAQEIRVIHKFQDKQIWNILAKNKKIQEDLLLEHTYNSTTIEGTTFSKKETEAVIFDHALIASKPLKEHLEVTNHAVLLRQIFEKKYREPVSEILIKEFHRVLLQGIREDAGQYATHLRAIRGVDLQLPHPEDIPEEMNHLIKRWQKKTNQTKIEKIAEFHSNFEAIHPFGDGNGRVGRAVMAYQCLQAHFPPIIIENNRKAEYYETLEYSQKKSLLPFTLFLCEEMKRTALLLQKHL